MNRNEDNKIGLISAKVQGKLDGDWIVRVLYRLPDDSRRHTSFFMSNQYSCRRLVWLLTGEMPDEMLEPSHMAAVSDSDLRVSS